MKRTGQIAIALILVMLIPAGIISGQEKKEQKQIKVIVSDKDGKQSVIIDTTFNGKTSTVKVVEGQPVMIMEGGHTMSWTAASPGGEENFVYVTKSHKEIKDGQVKYNIEVIQDESGNKTEKTSYVIAKDGMVVNIEGDSEEKVKELAAVIEAKLGVKKDATAKPEVVKEETKKTTKK